jgi:hypothetical protein
MRICSFDIGEKNFAYCVANCVATVDNSSAITIDAVHHHDVVCKKRQTVEESCIMLSHILDDDPLICKCDVMLIEQQTQVNIRAQRLSQHVWSSLFAKYGKKPIFVSPRLKFSYFLETKTLNYNERKKWSVNKMMHLLNSNKDIIDQIQVFKKKDDIADAILQLFAWYGTHGNKKR